MKMERYWTRSFNGNFDITQSIIYKKPPYPYSDDLVVSLDDKGAPLSHFGDDCWDYSALEKSLKLTWCGGKNLKVSNENLRLVKSIILAMIYDKRLLRGGIARVRSFKTMLMKYAVICDQHKKADGQHLLISDLSAYPKLRVQIAECFQSDWYREYSILEKLRLYSEDVGFELLNEESLQKIVEILAKRPVYLQKQHPVIPPRIWQYQVCRIEALLADFNSIKVALFKIIADVKQAKTQNERIFFQNQKVIGVSTKSSPPYINPIDKVNVFEGKVVFSKSFHEMLEECGVLEKLDSYRPRPKKNYTLQSITTILDGFRDAALAYVQFFSLQRIKETLSLYSECLDPEYDERFGEICILSGETSKTLVDDDAKWLVLAPVKIRCYLPKFKTGGLAALIAIFQWQ